MEERLKSIEKGKEEVEKENRKKENFWTPVETFQKKKPGEQRSNKHNEEVKNKEKETTSSYEDEEKKERTNQK